MAAVHPLDVRTVIAPAATSGVVPSTTTPGSGWP